MVGLKCSKSLKLNETPVPSNAIRSNYTRLSHAHVHPASNWLFGCLPGYTWVCSPINPGRTELEEPLLLNSLEELAQNSVVWYQPGLGKFEVITTELGKCLLSNCKAYLFILNFIGV